INPTEKLTLVIGASYDYFDPKKAEDPLGDVLSDPNAMPDSTSSFNPQAGVVYQATASTSVHASVGKKTRFPHMKELFSNYKGGNPDLDPQKTIAYEIGVEHWFTSRISGSIAYFYNDVTDLIREVTFNEGTDDELDVYVNIDEARYQGVEATLDMVLTDSLYAGMSYTYLSTKDKETGSDLPFTPRHKVDLDLRYRFPFGLTASVQGSYTQRQFDEDHRKMPDFFLLGARLAQDISITDTVRTTLFVEGSNLTDKDYQEDSGPEPGRMYRAGLAVRF
ncbi:MAG: TonB-dependent receptor, partial [Desulfomonilia bacterium]